MEISREKYRRNSPDTENFAQSALSSFVVLRTSARFATDLSSAVATRIPNRVACFDWPFPAEGSGSWLHAEVFACD
jgi:hypothetical protein